MGRARPWRRESGSGTPPRSRASGSVIGRAATWGGTMRIAVCAFVAAIALAPPALAQGERAPTFWKTVQATCDGTAGKPASPRGRRIAQTAIDEFTSFGGHRIDSNGRLFRFGLTEAEHDEDEGGNGQGSLGHLGWWHVMKYWRGGFGGGPAAKLGRGGDSGGARPPQ